MAHLPRILAHASDQSIPIFSGAPKPLIASMGSKWAGHGVDGLGGSIGVAPSTPPSENHAVSALLRFAKAHPKELTIVAIGPATNLALAAMLDPTFVENLKEVIYMGCTTRGQGNTTPHAEFNVASDPEAAHILLTQFASKLTIVSWETVCDAHLTWSFYDELIALPTPTARFLQRIFSAYEQYRPSASSGKQQEFILCDAYATALLVADCATDVSFANGYVELSQGPTRGACHWVPSNAPATKLVHMFDVDRFKALLRHLMEERGALHGSMPSGRSATTC
ncbi:hypothetical protein SDRG_05784 [Saprolegnia diclina VS20]|uniref:Inosine/uridine-preferring nucleoside hydrolase domain-containing protein n=1 Tax=Saprolegnia diclina (strain VS20) TaxID=1156394 RepID=T0QSL2_SAPDV|nr:hypothetical protein SDRG_05784 [Saprolegnia diclina VS20]EQC36960.1 hypothetical protein SDRG_05784 [Saprolegnia diclina VS20]|eukprot:XP_008609741.1 hypothetical protein SDRG_05784 [Saprolegnia diclina VS20]